MGAAALLSTAQPYGQVPVSLGPLGATPKGQQGAWALRGDWHGDTTAHPSEQPCLQGFVLLLQEVEAAG